MCKKKSGYSIPIVVLITLGMLLYGSATVRAATPEGVFKAAIHWSISGDWLDPATAGFPVSAYLPLYLFHDSLVKTMPEGLYTPCLAESWKNSPDYKIYEFNLRKGVKFHNGDSLTAEDVIFTFQRYKGVNAATLQRKIEKLEAVDPYLFRVTFKEAFPDFIDYLLQGMSSIGWIVPKKYIEKVGDAGYKKHPIGCSTYKFVEFSAGVRLTGEAFEGYWRKVPHIKRMEFYIITEIATRYSMLKRGEVDEATLMIDVFYKRVKQDPELKVFEPQTSVVWVVRMPPQFDPKSPWSDPRVRQAASLAIDRKGIVEVHFPGGVPVGSYSMPGEPDPFDRPPDPYDPDRARKLLAEAGYATGFHGGKFYPYDGPYWPLGEQIANYWKAIGIIVDTQLLDRTAWISSRMGGKMKGAIFNEPVGAPTVSTRLGYLFAPAAAYGNYPEVDALWNRFNRTLEPQPRKDLINRLRKRVTNLRSAYTSPKYFRPTPAAFRLRVKGNPLEVQCPPI